MSEVEGPKRQRFKHYPIGFFHIEATVKRFHYESHEQLRRRLADFMATYNFARRRKTLSDLTPYEYIAKIWTSDRFNFDPIHQMPN